MSIVPSTYNNLFSISIISLEYFVPDISKGMNVLDYQSQQSP